MWPPPVKKQWPSALLSSRLIRDLNICKTLYNSYNKSDIFPELALTLTLNLCC